MSNNKSSSSSGGVGLLGLVFIVFLILKLAQIGIVADWSWWWVTSPLWIPIAILICIVIPIYIIYLLAKERKSKRELKSFIDRLNKRN